MPRFLIVVFIASSLLLGCTSDRAEPNKADGSTPADEAGVKDSSPKDLAPKGDVSPGACKHLGIGATASFSDSEAQDGLSFSRFAWSGDGYVGVWQNKGGKGFRFVHLDRQGAQQGPLQTLWPSHDSAQQAQLAVSSDVLAIVYGSYQGAVNPRPICMMALTQLSGTEVKAPFLVKDPSQPGSDIFEIGACTVVADDLGFAVSWSEMSASGDLEWTVLLQLFDRVGQPRADPVVLAQGADKGLMKGATLAWTGEVVVAAHMDANGQPLLTTIQDGQMQQHPLQLFEWRPGGLLTMGFVGVLLASWNDQLAAINLDGTISKGPVQVDISTRLTPLADSAVLAYKREFLVANLLDQALNPSGEPLGISTERDVFLHQLEGAPDGSTAGVFYFEEGLQFAELRCASEPPPPLGPPDCPPNTTGSPLDDGCTDPVCHAVIRLDYLSLGLKGYAVMGGEDQPVDEAGAKTAAEAVFIQYGDYFAINDDISVSSPQAGMFHALYSAGDFGGFALVAQDSGEVVAAGGIVWMGHGSWWIPAAWQPASDLACGDVAAAAVSHADPDYGCGDNSGNPSGPYDATDALDLALRLNLTAHFASRGPFSAYTYLYTPAVGTCDPSVAEFVVVLSQKSE